MTGLQNKFKALQQDIKNILRYPRNLMALGGLVLLIIIFVLIDFFTSVRVVKISELNQLNARKSVITIQYNKPVSRVHYKPASKKLFVESSLSKDKFKETHKIVAPTKFNAAYTMKLNPGQDDVKLLGVFYLCPEVLNITTGIEEIYVKGLIPPENSNPSPETFDNQLGVEFSGEIMGKYKKGINIPENEMDYVKLSPPVMGYYRWSSDSLLTFNFTGDKPQFETAYEFEIFPKKFINPEYQVWTGDRSKYRVTTSANEVYVVDFSPVGNVTWQTPIRIEFSGNMAGALDVLKKKSPDMIPVDITPKPGGVWVWQNARTLEFKPDKYRGLPVKKMVTVTIHPAINKDPERKWRGEKPVEYSFYVMPRKQYISSYNIHGDSAPLEDDLIVTFSRAMVKGDRLHKPIPREPLTKDVPLIISSTIKGKLYWISPNRLKFHPDNLWSQLTQYKVRLNPGYDPDPSYEWTGTTDFTFKTVENVVRAEFFFTPEDRLSPTTFFSHKGRYKKNKDIPPELRLWIDFDRDLGRFAARNIDLNEVVVIKPAIKGEFKWLSHRLVEFVPQNNWRENTGYSVQLTKKLLHHPEQHFFEGQDSFNFSSGKNRVRSPQITQASINKNKPAAHNPVDPLNIDFSRNINPIIKVGRVYKIQEMKPGSLPVKIQPEIDVTLNWYDNRRLTIRPVGYWKPGTVYKITLNPQILPQSETKFELGNTFYIQTQKNRYAIKRFSPRGKVGRRIIIDVEFSKNIKPADIKPGKPDNTGLFSVSPRINGEWKWLADNKLQFKPVEPLAPATTYTVVFDPNRLPDKQFTWHISPDKGKVGYSPVEYNFFTPALQVVKTNARFEFNEKDILKQRFFLDIELSEPVYDKDLRRHFSIWYDKIKDKKTIQVPLLYQLQSKTGPSRGIQKFSVVSDWIDRPAKDRKIQYKITAGLKPAIGDLNLAADYSGYFYQEKPKYIAFNRINWQWKDRKYKAVLSFNAPIEPRVLKRFLTVGKMVQKEEKPLDYEVSVSSSNTRRDFKYEVTSEFTPGGSYYFRVKEGLMAADGSFAPDPITKIYTAPDLAQKLEFALNGSILSRKDLTRVPVLTTNISRFYIIIDKIFANNVNYYINNRIDSANIGDIAQNIIKKEYQVHEIVGKVSGQATKNRLIITHIDLSQLFKDNIHGLFRVSVSKYSYLGSRNAANSRWFLATDIGLIARRFDDNLVVWANSLYSPGALAGVKVEAFDRWNQAIGTGYTDMEGFARLSLNKGAVPTHVLAKRGDDFSLLDMRKHRDRLAGFDIEGISSKKSMIRSYIYSERGVYRPGERVHLVAVTRGKEGVLPEDYPVTFRLSNPTGKHVVSERYTLDKHGLYVYDFDVPAEAKTGKWQAAMLWKGNNIGSYTFQVEEFIPNKIKVNLELLSKQVYAGDTLRFKVKAVNLFGPPAADRPVSGSINLRPDFFKPKGYNAYTFGHDDNKFQRLDEELAEVQLDSEGTHIFEYQVLGNIDSPIGLTAHYSATVIDTGGRGVSSYGSTDVLLYSQFVGVLKLTKGVINIDTPVRFRIVNVDADGNPGERSQQKLSITVYRNKLVTHYRKNERGYYRYVTEKERILADTLGDTRDNEGKLVYTPRFSGEHILEVEDLIGKQVTRYTFHVHGEEKLSQFVKESDKVELTVLDQEVSVNDQVKIEIHPPFPGKVLIMGERDKILFTRVLDITAGKQIITIPIQPSYLPNFYISAIAVKPVHYGGRHDPIYAAGLVNIDVKDRSHEPGIKLIMPGKAIPNSELKVSLKVADTNNSNMHFTIAAVDVGILELTRYKLPVMTGYFNQKRRLEVDHYSMYPMVMPFDPEVKHTIYPSGDAPSRALIKKKRVSPDSQKRVKSVALWSGLLKLDANGGGTVKFKIPDFNGTLRVMAVAFGNQRFASKEKEIVVRDKLVMKPTLPRFMATDDDLIIPVTIYNGTETDGNISIKIKVSDHIKLLGPAHKTVFVPVNGENSVDFSVKVNHLTGVSVVELSAEGVGESVGKKVEVPVRAPGTMVTKSGSGVVDKNTPRSIKMPGGFIEGTAEYAVKVSATPLIRFQNSLSYLLRYPHGCLEQTTSKLFPLLYFSDMAKSAGKVFTAKKGPRYFLNEGISKIERMQMENGVFSYWEGQGHVNNWSSVYASHFLVEAQKAGLKIDNKVWNSMIDYLQQKASVSLNKNNLYNRSYGVNHSLYILYVLALADENVQSKLNYIYDNYFDRLKTHDRARLAAAFFTSGDQKTAIKIISTIDVFDEYDIVYRDTGGHFASNVRDLSIILDALVTAAPQSSRIPILVSRIAEKTMGGRWGSTQENAFALLAIGKAAASKAIQNSKVKISLGDGTVVPFVGEVLLKTPELLKGEVRIEVSGKDEVTYAWEAVGIIKDPESLQQDKGIQVRRRFLDHNGDPVDFSNITQGALVVAEIKIKSATSTLENVVITDLLPAGLEIENTRLSTSASLPWIKQDIKLDYLDIRDDRINIFLTVPTDEKTYYYTTRAVTVGNFKVPAIRAEAMYDPEIYSEADSGRIKILPKEGRSLFVLDLE
jgi:uncharacterized protein YfaS (alpha-2-macroglobulin family)